MTTPPPRRRAFDELPPLVVVEPQIRTSAGNPVTARILITNRAPEPRVMAVTTLGVDADWLPHPSRSRPLMPGETVAADLTFDPKTGTVPASYPLAIAVQALDPVRERATSTTAIADTALIVDAPGQIGLEIKPVETSAYLKRRITVLLHNTGSDDDYIRLDVHSTGAAEVELDADAVDVPANSTVPVRGRIHVRPRTFGNRQRFTYTLSASGSGSPRRVEGAVTSKAFFGSSATRFTVFVVLVALWGALAIIFIPKLASTIQNNQNKAADRAAAAQSKAVTQPSGGSTSSGSAGAGGGRAGGAAGGAAGSAAGAASNIQLAGTISGQSPGGVRVSIAPTSLVDEAAQAATPVGVDAAAFTEIGKIPQSGQLLTRPSTAVQSRSTTSQTDGTWSFGSVHAPGYYLLVFSKPGYQTQQYIVDSSNAAAAQPIKVNLVPGGGSLSGRVTGPSGAVGGAQITISDGSNTITTSSNTKGDVGAWSVTGLSTPDSYVVTAGKSELSTESSLVNLAAGGASSVNLTLKAGVGSLLGRVIGTDSLGHVGGLGAVAVTATNGTITRTASTVTPPTTSHGDIAGDFTLPDLPPGKYTLTASQDGYLPQTQAVTIGTGVSSVRVPTISLQAATASVTGRVFECVDTVRTCGSTTGANGAGLTLSSETNTYKTVSGGDGTFRIDGVTPGTYTLSAQLFNFSTVFANIVAVAGQTADVPSTALVMPHEILSSSNSIKGFIASAVSPSGQIGCIGTSSSASSSSGSGACTVNITITMTDENNAPVLISLKPAADQQPTYASSASLTPSPTAGGPTEYDLVGQIPGSGGGPNQPLPAGLYHLTIKATGYLTAKVNVRVPFNGIGTAPQVNLFPSDTISGTIGAPGTLGDLNHLGPPAGVGTASTLHPPYTNCVWVFPIDELPSSAPTNCATPPAPLASLPPPRCDSSGQAEVRMAVIDDLNSYKIENLCDGSYQAYLVVTNPWYLPNTTPAVETVQHGQTATFSPTIQRLGRVLLTLTTVNPEDGTVTQATAGVGTASCGGISFGDTNSITNGKVTISGVAAGAATCNVTLTNGSSTYDGSITVTVNNNNDTSATLTLSQTVDGVWGRIVSPYDSSSTNPVVGAVVTLTGTTKPPGGVAGSQTVQVTTDTNGCFLVTKDGHALTGTVTPPAPCDAVVPSPNASPTIVGTGPPPFPLITRQVSLAVSPGGGIVGIPGQNVTLAGTSTSLNQFSSNPTPVSTSTITITSQSLSANLAGATVTVTPVQATGGGTVSVQVASGTTTLPGPPQKISAGINWTDSIIRQLNQAWPGTYHITVSLPGFSSASATVTCSFNTSACGTTALDIEQLGSLSGQIQAVLGDQLTYTSTNLDPLTGTPLTVSYPTQVLPGATVSAAPCTGTTTSTCPGWTTTPTGVVSAVTDSGGNFGTPSTMTPGLWTVKVSAPGYTTWITTITINGGANNITSSADSPRNWLFETPVRFDVGIQTGSGLFQCPSSGPTTCASVTLHRIDTSQGDIVVNTQNTAHRYEFDNLNPATYAITVTGDGLRQTTTQFTVPLGNTQPFDIPVTLIQNTISGAQAVLASTGKNLTTTAPINGIPVELGHLDSGGAFVPDTDASGHALAQQTSTIAGFVGSFNFTNVPNGTYAIRYNGETATGFNESYQTTVSTGFYSVNGGQAVSVPAVTLVRVLHTVTFTVTTTDNNDNVSGSTNVQLTNTTDSTWTVAPSSPTTAPATGGGNVSTWVFSNDVPVGTWHLSITLPSGHYGQLSATGHSDAMSCTAGSTTSPVTCTATVAVHGGHAGGDVIESYALDEFQVGLHVVLSNLTTDPSPDSPPTTVKLSVTDGTHTVYTNDTFPVGGTAPSATFWGATGTSYSSSIPTTGTGAPPVNWQPAVQTFTSANPSRDITLQELGASVSITIANTPAYNNGSATITLTDPATGITYAAAPSPDATPNNGGTVTYSDVPFSTANYTATLSGSYTTGSGSTLVTHTIGGSVSFPVGALTVTQTLTPTVS